MNNNRVVRWLKRGTEFSTLIAVVVGLVLGLSTFAYVGNYLLDRMTAGHQPGGDIKEVPMAKSSEVLRAILNVELGIGGNLAATAMLA